MKQAAPWRLVQWPSITFAGLPRKRCSADHRQLQRRSAQIHSQLRACLRKQREFRIAREDHEANLFTRLDDLVIG